MKRVYKIFSTKMLILTFIVHLIISSILTIVLYTEKYNNLYTYNSYKSYNNTFIEEAKNEARRYAAAQAKSIAEYSSKHSIEEKTPIYSNYKLTAGDSWWGISHKYYGDGAYCYALAAYNNNTINDSLYIGNEIKIPDIKDKEFLRLCSEYSIETPTNNQVLGYVYGKHTPPAVNINTPSNSSDMKNYTGFVDTSNYELLGSYKITGYTPSCVHCCGKSDGIGASGVEMICGYSVAAPKSIPFGTTLYIEGYGFYVVEDRGGFGNNVIDIACPTHNSCGSVTSNGKINVFVVKVKGEKKI